MLSKKSSDVEGNGVDYSNIFVVYGKSPQWTGFYTKGRPLVKSNLICPSDKLSWQPGCPILNINIQGNFCITAVFYLNFS